MQEDSMTRIAIVIAASAIAMMGCSQREELQPQDADPGEPIAETSVAADPEAQPEKDSAVADGCQHVDERTLKQRTSNRRRAQR